MFPFSSLHSAFILAFKDFISFYHRNKANPSANSFFNTCMCICRKKICVSSLISCASHFGVREARRESINVVMSNLCSFECIRVYAGFYNWNRKKSWEEKFFAKKLMKLILICRFFIANKKERFAFFAIFSLVIFARSSKFIHSKFALHLLSVPFSISGKRYILQ